MLESLNGLMADPASRAELIGNLIMPASVFVPLYIGAAIDAIKDHVRRRAAAGHGSRGRGIIGRTEKH